MKDNVGNLLGDPMGISNLIRDYFVNLFTIEKVHNFQTLSWLIDTYSQNIINISSIPRDSEVNEALFSLAP